MSRLTNIFEIHFHISFKPHHKHAGSSTGRHIRFIAEVRWTTDNWTSFTDTTATPMVGIYFVDLATNPGQIGTTIQFTMFWLDSQTWQGGPNFLITLVA